MPELPEVETVCNGLRPYLQYRTFTQVLIREFQLRWPVPVDLAAQLVGQQVLEISRRGKYCLIHTHDGTLIVHLGMSGSLQIMLTQQAVKLHDHVDFCFDDQICLRFNDPRKFGAVLWTTQAIENHRLLKDLGPEPLTAAFTAQGLYAQTRGRRRKVKTLIMDGHIVVGVGNIYASEALFIAGILPSRAGGELSLDDCHRLVAAIRQVLQQAIAQGGTSLKDFINAEGKPGYFSQSLAVYGRAGQACYRCQQRIEQQLISQRMSYFCPYCQA
jgi:formamidopyrimidine-DNA glycosylase